MNLKLDHYKFNVYFCILEKPSVTMSQNKPPNSPHHQPVAIPVHLSAESSSVVSVNNTSAQNRGSMG